MAIRPGARGDILLSLTTGITITDVSAIIHPPSPHQYPLSRLGHTRSSGGASGVISITLFGDINSHLIMIE
jgi:hypothetical protein